MNQIPITVIETTEFNKYNNLEKDLTDLLDGFVMYFEQVNSIITQRYPEINTELESRAANRRKNTEYQEDYSYTAEPKEEISHIEEEVLEDSLELKDLDLI